MRTHHPQVRISWREYAAEVDEKLAPLILELWKADIPTELSCQRHTTGKVWLCLADTAAFEAFMNILATEASPEWARREQWYFGQFEPVAGPLPTTAVSPEGWEYHVTLTDDSLDDDAQPTGEPPAFRLCVNVLFPRRDLKHVLAGVRAHNARRKPE